MNIFILLCIFLTISLVYPYSIEIDPEVTECFIIEVAKGLPCTGSFEVISIDPKPIVVTVNGPPPLNVLHFESKYKSGIDSDKILSEGSFSFDADEEGEHKMCISNGFDYNDGLSRIIAFNFRTVNAGQSDYQYVGLESELNDLRQGLDQLKDHQSYMSQREDVHKSTLEGINTKVLCWTILEAIILIGMTFWQISYISGFFETKRKL